MDKILDTIKIIINNTFDSESHRQIKVSDSRVNFRCPVCRGSNKLDIDMRAKIFPLNNGYRFICWNCSLICSYESFVNRFKPLLREHKIKDLL